MADQKRDPLKDRISALPDMPAATPPTGYKPAVPPTYPGRDFARRPIPRPAVEIPKSAPVHEPTKVETVPPPSPGSAPMPPGKRSYSPAPFASPEEEAAIEAMAESRGERVVAPAKPPPVETVVVHEYRLDPGTRTWLRGLVALVLGALGLGTYGAIKPAPEAPPVVPMACSIMCPTGKLPAEAATKLPAPQLHAMIHCCEIVEALENSKAAVIEAAKARELAGKASDKATIVEKKVPAVNP